jgi:hypothetical protein
MPEPTTRLHVWITGYDEEDKEKIKQLMDEGDFPIHSSHKPSDEGVEFQSRGFEYNDENLSLVQGMKQKFESEFPSRNVDLEDGTLGEHVAIDYFECIRIKDDTDSKAKNSTKKLSEKLSTSMMEKEGLTTTVDWKDKDFDQRKVTKAERGSGWSAWYPCPECGSTKLLERIEEVLTVTVNDEGEIIKEMSDGEEIYFKCAECNKELVNEW